MKKLKLFFACLLMAVLSIGQVWATEYTHTFATSTQSISGDVCTVTVADGHPLSIIAEKNGGSNFASYAPFRLYNKNKMTISANSGYVITQVDISFSSAQNLTVATDAVDYSYESYSFVPKDGEGNAASCSTVSFTNGNSSQARIASITITYQESGSTPTCATPTFSPAAGSYEGTQNVTISSTTGATIYYTTDGTTPSTSSSVYSSPIAVSADMTIKAYAVKAEYDDSEVAEAAYTITEGPDVTINLLDEGWGFPTSKVVAETSYTNGDYTIKVAGTTGQGFRTYGTYFLLGQNGAYIELPEFANPIEKIVVSGNSGGSGTVTWNIFKGDDAVSAAASGCKNDAYTFNIDPVEANAVYRLKVTSAANLQIKTIKIFFGAAPAVAKPTISGDENFVTSTTVTISHADADHIYYTTNGDAPTTGSTEYTAPFTVNADGTTTVKAIAVKGSDVSAIAEKTFTKVEALESMAALLEATTSTETAFNVVISNWVVTGVNGSRAWIADAANEKGILLYKSGHNFVAGNKLNGVVLGTKTKLYQGYPEMTTLVSTDVTVTSAETITPRTTTIAALTSGHPNEQGTVVKLENLTYTASSTSFSDGENSIQADNKLYTASLLDGATYNLTGVVEYLDGSVVKIMPRSVDDVEQTSAASLPEVTGLAALKAEATGTSYLLNLTDAIVTLVDGSNAFIEDATAGALIYKSGHGFSAGDKLNGQYEVTTATYQGKFEITAIAATTGTKTTDAEIPVTTLTIAQLNANFAANESKRIKIVGVNVTDAVESGDATARTGEISDGENTITLYAGKSGVTAAENANIDVIGYPTFHNTDQQLAVWAQADITVNEKEDPEISYSPATQTIEEGDDWSAPTFNNPHSLAIASYVSSNEAVATVTDGGVIALAGGIGTAVITAHTDGDATYAAGNATYTITVNEAGVYSMSFDLTKVSYDDAADAEVVWNSNVVTITAQQGTGTKVTNYLAGNYSGTTLIEETRLYENNILTFTPKTGVTITKVEWIATAKAYAESLAKDGTTTAWTNATAALDAEYTTNKKVIITPSAEGAFSAVLGKSGSNKGTRGASVVVYYTAESEKSKLTASIAIDDMNMAVGDDDILLSAIAATSNPNKKAISYAVTSGTAVSIVGEGAEAALHAVAEGTATVTATIPDNLGNYTGATKTFTVTVAAAPATLVSIAISGEATALEYTAGQHYNPAGLVVTGTYSDASTAPITEGIDWTFDPDPLTEGTTSVSVTATVGEISSAAVVVNGLTVSAAPAPTSKKVVIIAEFDSKLYAMSNTVASKACAAIEVEKDGSNLVVSSTEDKAAVQWLMTTSGEDVTLQDADDNYLSASSGDLSVAAAAANWSLTQDGGYYLISMASGRALMYRNTNVFKHYSTGNTDGYAKVSEIFEVAEGATNIVITSKVDPELAYTPASDEITVGDDWSAPVLGYVEGFDGLEAISYESSNEAVATVSDAGVIALAGGTGTATITATFGGNASYLAGSATYTVKVNEVPDNCDATDDFSTANSSSPTSYTTRTTTAGWSATNAGYKVINDASYLMINGKTTAVGVITSPVLSDGIASLKFRYANTNNESNGVSVRIDIKQGTEVVKTYTLTKANSEVTKDVVYTEIIENINVTGEFQIIFTNLSPSNNTGNADRVSIGRLCWKNYSSTPEPVYTTVRTGLEAGRHYTVCLKNNVTAVKGATFWSLTYKNAAGTEAYLVQETEIEAGKPYIFQATNDNDGKLEVVYGEDVVSKAGTNGALVGTFDYMDAVALAEVEGTVYMLFNNELRPIGTNNHLDAYRAYVLYNLLQLVPAAGFAPGKRVKGMPLHQDAATGFENINASEKPMKLMIDGNIYILRGEKMYDATGRLVK